MSSKKKTKGKEAEIIDISSSDDEEIESLQATLAASKNSSTKIKKLNIFSNTNESSSGTKRKNPCSFAEDQPAPKKQRKSNLNSQKSDSPIDLDEQTDDSPSLSLLSSAPKTLSCSSASSSFKDDSQDKEATSQDLRELEIEILDKEDEVDDSTSKPQPSARFDYFSKANYLWSEKYKPASLVHFFLQLCFEILEFSIFFSKFCQEYTHVSSATRNKIDAFFQRLKNPNEAKRTLILYGPPGCGKKTLLELICSKTYHLPTVFFQEPQNLTWTEQQNSNYNINNSSNYILETGNGNFDINNQNLDSEKPRNSNFNNDFNSYKSYLGELEDFLFWTTRTAGLSNLFTSEPHSNVKNNKNKEKEEQLILPNVSRVAVVASIPNFKENSKKNQFERILRRLCNQNENMTNKTVSRNPVVFMHTSYSTDNEKNEISRVFPKDILDHSTVEVVQFRKYTENSIKQVCHQVFSSEKKKYVDSVAKNAKSGIKRGNENFLLIEQLLPRIVESSDGDMRCAIQKLQFLMTSKLQASQKIEILEKKTKNSKKNSSYSSSYVDMNALDCFTSSDLHFSIFHVAGKILYGKRDPGTGKFENDYELLGDQVHSEKSRIVAYILENLPNFSDIISQYGKILKDISFSDVLQSVFVTDSTFPTKEILQDLGFSIASRSVVHFRRNELSKKRRLITSPKYGYFGNYSVISETKRRLSHDFLENPNQLFFALDETMNNNTTTTNHVDNVFQNPLKIEEIEEDECMDELEEIEPIPEVKKQPSDEDDELEKKEEEANDGIETEMKAEEAEEAEKVREIPEEIDSSDFRLPTVPTSRAFFCDILPSLCLLKNFSQANSMNITQQQSGNNNYQSNYKRNNISNGFKNNNYNQNLQNANNYYFGLLTPQQRAKIDWMHKYDF